MGISTISMAAGPIIGINNLREASRSVNRRNQSRPKNNTSGVLGVVWDKRRKKWRAEISVNGKQINLGRFSRLFEAAAHRKLATFYFGFGWNHGRSGDVA